jgi:U3 small nucleolar RNA-associated protein 21
VPLPFKSRSGHHGPPVKIKYYGSYNNNIVSAGRDKSLRSFCTSRDNQNYEFSQGSLAKKAKSRGVDIDELKLPQISDFDVCKFIYLYTF